MYAMQHFSLYHSFAGLLEKTICALTERCHNNNLRVVIIVPSADFQEKINELLWTYSPKQFIPHGSKLDPMAEQQPIYITCEKENPNNAALLMIVNPSNIADFSEDRLYIARFQRILVIYDDSIIINQNIIQQLKQKAELEHYTQSPSGGWSLQA